MNMTDIYERNINIAVARKNAQEIVTKATMLDLNHHIRVELTVNLQNETIVDAQAQMTKVPYSICQLTLGNLKKIVGLKIEPGVHKRLVDMLGHADGCIGDCADRAVCRLPVAALAAGAPASSAAPLPARAHRRTRHDPGEPDRAVARGPLVAGSSCGSRRDVGSLSSPPLGDPQRLQHGRAHVRARERNGSSNRATASAAAGTPGSS